MKIGLFDIDSKYHNLALMKLSTYHKRRGHKVEFYQPYYSLYNLDYSLGFTTRGCIRNCKFCIVPEKEGMIKEHAEVEEFLNTKSNVVVLLDNNFLALPSHIKKLQKYINKSWRMDFNQGLDARLINKENAKLLARIKYKEMIRFAWDNIKDETEIIKGLKLVIKAGIRPRNITVYVLIGFDTTFKEDLYRIQRLRDIKDERGSIKPYVMNYNNTLKSRKYKDFMRWVNNPWIFKSCEWEEYKKWK